MIVSIANTPRDFGWGSTTSMAHLLGIAPSGEPQAELWLGAHPGSPSRIIDPEATGGATDVLQWIDRDPHAALGDRAKLPFLMKVLAADSSLSLQAHPTAEQAAAGFARENALGIPLDAPHRNYRDDQPKPEIIVALSDRFEALCGFRAHHEAAEALTALDVAELVPRLVALPELFGWLMAGGPEVDALVARVAARVAQVDAEGVADMDADIDTARRLGEAHPGDPGIICALLLNRVTLRRGEALFLPAGNIHAYLEGVGVEVMSSSDNVLRGGLTAKHVDVPELLHVLNFAQGAPPWLHPEQAKGIDVFRPEVADFVLMRITGDGDVPLTGPAIALCTAGSLSLSGTMSEQQVSLGESVYITPDELNISVRGHGELFLATTP